MAIRPGFLPYDKRQQSLDYKQQQGLINNAESYVAFFETLISKGFSIPLKFQKHLRGGCLASSDLTGLGLLS